MKLSGKFGLKNSIALRLLKVVFGLYLIVAFVVTIGHMALEYRYQKNSIKTDLINLQYAFEPPLTLAVWEMNQEALESTIVGMLMTPAITNVVVQTDNKLGFDENSMIVQKQIDGNGDIQGDSGLLKKKSEFRGKTLHSLGMIKHTFYLKYFYKNVENKIGKVTFYSDASVVFRRIKLQFFLLITNALLKTAALWGIFLFFFTSFLKKPLDELTAATKKIDFNSLIASKIDLNKSGKDELLILGQSFNLMIDNLHRSIAAHRLAESEIKLLNSELEERVKQRTIDLKVKTEELEVFTYSVSHDLKAPLRGIDGYSKLLLEDYITVLDEEGQIFLKNIRQATGQMNQLINDLLTYSRLERKSLMVQHVALLPIIHQAIDKREHDFKVGNIKIHAEIPDISVTADPESLIQIFGNIIDNAIKYSKKACPPAIEIEVKETRKSCIVIIKDNGIGFDMKYHDRIFEIFQRLTRAEEYSGTGIGLAIVSKALERIQGRVWAESKPGQGASFYLEIPR